MMKKIAVLCVVVSAYLQIVIHAQECHVLRVGGTSEWLPVAYINQETQKPEGISYDLAKIVGEGLNIPVIIDATLPWKRMMLYVEMGRLDMIAAIYWTQERDTLYQYTAPYFVNEARVFVVKGKEFPFEKLEDLIGRTGGIPLGGSFGEVFDIFAKANQLKLEEVTTKEQRVKKILAGRNDYFIQDYLDCILYLKQVGLRDQIVPLPHPVSTTEVYFAVSRKSPCAALVPQMNAIIEKAKQDGTLQTIIDKYIK
ncbi:conserved exported hypothetical protein [Desulfamplus magnetovallimortis]|uniref:Solute-binding protein family 3/N-terminal domain-containing protein n=1 Tax=Desulfamplus magnetovallimortis TaxID=1246637 RepID=A0A1W1HG93_9BACT|nr:transporter substrate-binding domain-containing protein [Desulfamplus magnetovallimortis]SLM31402.1 conserved exported hypothetical protein [Desulfamplus magnetovallimortis]